MSLCGLSLGKWSLKGNWETSSPSGLLYFWLTVHGSGNLKAAIGLNNGYGSSHCHELLIRSKADLLGNQSLSSSLGSAHHSTALLCHEPVSVTSAEVREGWWEWVRFSVDSPFSVQTDKCRYSSVTCAWIRRKHQHFLCCAPTGFCICLVYCISLIRFLFSNANNIGTVVCWTWRSHWVKGWWVPFTHVHDVQEFEADFWHNKNLSQSTQDAL